MSIYNTLILPHINYNITLWGHHSQKILKLQKKAVRLVSAKPYNSHTDPLFKDLNLLKIGDIYRQSLLKVYYDFSKGNLPTLLQKELLVKETKAHRHFTRSTTAIHKPRINHKFAEYSFSYAIPSLVNETQNNILSKIDTHSRKGFSNYIQKNFIELYTDVCVLENCYICSRL